MKIKLNNKTEEFEKDKLTVRELLEIKNFTFKMIVVKINGAIIEEKDYDNAEIKNGDDVMVIHIFAGG